MAAADSASIDAFLEMMLAERGAAANTVEAYQRDLKDATAFLTSRKTSLADASQAQIEAYLASLAKSGVSPRTQARRLSSLKQYYRFLFSEKQRADDPTATLNGPRLGRGLPKTISENHVTALLEAARAEEGAEGLRLTALLEILYSSGLRVSELVGLPFGPLKGLKASKGACLVSVRGKGGKERLIPLSETALCALEAYLPARAVFLKEGEDSPWLFPSRGSHLTRQRFGQVLKALGPKAGIEPKRLSPHALRHSFASHLLAGGADLRVIQEMLGHSDIATTQIYTFVEQAALTKLVQNHHPLARPRARR